MKRLSCIMFAVLLLFLYASCSKKWYYTYEELSKGLTEVEIVDVEESGAINVLCSLDEQKKNECVYFLTKIAIARRLFGDPVTIIGICIRLIYENDSHLLICDYGVLPHQVDSRVRYTWEYVVNGEKITELINSLMMNMGIDYN